MSTPAITGRTGQPGRRVSSALQYPGGASHGKRGDGFPTIASEESIWHPGDGDDGMPSAARLMSRRLRKRCQESSLPCRRPGTFSTAFAQSSHLFTSCHRVYHSRERVRERERAINYNYLTNTILMTSVTLQRLTSHN